jgi:hypothetical protein
MQAIEFIAKVEKGAIKVPKEYREQLQDQFRVIILQEATAPKKSSGKKRTLNAVKIKTKGFKFNF